MNGTLFITLTFSFAVIYDINGQRQSAPSQTASAVTSVREYMQHKAVDPQWDWKRSINFWGRVLDDSNNPVADANVHFVWTDLSANGTSEADTTSDPNGLFSLAGRTGKRLEVYVKKDGYYNSKGSVGSFEYANPGDKLFIPNQNKPVIFHLRKKGIGAELITKDTKINVFQRKTVSLPLGDQSALKIQLLTNAPMYQRQWAARVSVVNGGIQLSLDEFPFEAPASGYQSELALDYNTPKPPTWFGKNLYQGGQFYIKIGNGYGRMNIQMISGKSLIEVKTWINPTGSRNLEPK